MKELSKIRFWPKDSNYHGVSLILKPIHDTLKKIINTVDDNVYDRLISADPQEARNKENYYVMFFDKNGLDGFKLYAIQSVNTVYAENYIRYLSISMIDFRLYLNEKLMGIFIIVFCFVTNIIL